MDCKVHTEAKRGKRVLRRSGDGSARIELRLCLLSLATVSCALSMLLLALGQEVIGAITAAMTGFILLWVAVSLKSNVRATLYTLLILIILFLPPLPAIGDVRLWVHQIVLVLLAPMVLFRRPRAMTRIDALLAIFGLAIVLSLLFGYISNNTPLVRDWFELAKPGFWWLMYSFGLSVRWRPELKLRALWTLLWGGAGIGLFTLAQAQNWGGINARVTPLYVTTEERLRSLAYRAVGTFGNPNRLGTFLAAALCIALALLLFSEQTQGRRLSLIVYVFGTFSVIPLTASRFAFVAAVLTATALILTRVWYGRFTLLSKLVFIGTITAITAVLSILVIMYADRAAATMTTGQALLSGNPFVATLHRLDGVLEDFSSNSRRMSDWRLAWRLGMEAPIFGSGPSKGLDEYTYFHSEYLSVLRRYGFFGLSVFIFLCIAIATDAYRLFCAAIARREKQQATLALAVLAALIVYYVHGVVSNSPFSDFRASAVLWWLVGALYGQVETFCICDDNISASARACGGSSEVAPQDTDQHSLEDVYAP